MLRDLSALRLSRKVADQAGLGAGERWSNLRGAMTVPTRHTSTVCGAVVVLVDDVVTSGATLAEAGRALRCAGASDVVAVTLAATHRRRAGPSAGLDHALAGEAV
jgi:predicted amidophosphoribosyltransferase